MVANKGAGQESFNKPAAPDIEAIRAKAAAYAAKHQTGGQQSKFTAAKPAVQEDAGKQHRQEMRQDRVKGFSFTCGK